MPSGPRTTPLGRAFGVRSVSEVLDSVGVGLASFLGSFAIVVEGRGRSMIEKKLGWDGSGRN